MIYRTVVYFEVNPIDQATELPDERDVANAILEGLTEICERNPKLGISPSNDFSIEVDQVEYGGYYDENDSIFDADEA